MLGQAISSKDKLPSVYRVIAWCADGKCHVWKVTQVTAEHQVLSELRDAATMEMDEYVPTILKAVTDAVYAKLNASKSFMDWSVPMLLDWGLVQRKEVPQNGGKS